MDRKCRLTIEMDKSLFILGERTGNRVQGRALVGWNTCRKDMGMFIYGRSETGRHHWVKDIIM